MRKVLLSLLALLLLAALLPAAQAEAAAYGHNEETGFDAVIDDPAGLLDDSEIDGVLDRMDAVTAYANAGFLSRPEGDTGSGGQEAARKWGASRFGSTSPYAVFMVDMEARRLYVFASKSIYGTLTTAKANTITDNIYTYATDGDYARCAREAFRQIARVLGGEKISEPMKYSSNAFLAVICAILVTYMLIAGRMRNEQETTIQTLTRTVAAGAATAVTGHVLKKVVRHERSSGGGFHGGGGGGGFSGGGGGGGGSHGF